MNKIFDLLILAAGGLVSIEAILLIFQGHSLSTSTSGLGEISTSILLVLSIQIIAACLIVVMATAYSRLPALRRSANAHNMLIYASLISGTILIVEGLAAINISTTVSGDLASRSSLLAGLQLFCLGILVISRFIASEDKPALPKGISGSMVLIFFLLLLPATFLLV